MVLPALRTILSTSTLGAFSVQKHCTNRHGIRSSWHVPPYLSMKSTKLLPPNHYEIRLFSEISTPRPATRFTKGSGESTPDNNDMRGTNVPICIIKVSHLNTISRRTTRASPNLYLQLAINSKARVAHNIWTPDYFRLSFIFLIFQLLCVPSVRNYILFDWKNVAKFARVAQHISGLTFL